MTELSLEVRQPQETAGVIDISGDITSAVEELLMEAYSKATEGSDATKTIILNFSNLDYMNSGGIGLLVTLLVRANRQKQRLMAYGLSDHYREIFELTRLDEAIGIHKSEEDALNAAR